MNKNDHSLNVIFIYSYLFVANLIYSINYNTVTISNKEYISYINTIKTVITNNKLTCIRIYRVWVLHNFETV